MLETARLLGIVHEGLADSGTTTTLTDSELEYEAGYFTGGTLFPLTGSGMGQAYYITKFMENTITIDATLTTAFSASSRYAAANKTYSRQMLKQAVNFNLRQLVIPQVDTTMTVETNGTLTLSSGVYNVKRVLVGDEGEEKPNYYWDERGGVLYFDPGRAPDSAERITIWYVVPHGELVTHTAIINDQVDREWLAWASVVYCLRHKLTIIRRDDPMLIDMLNEAKMTEQQMKQKMKVQLNMPRDPRLAGW